MKPAKPNGEEPGERPGERPGAPPAWLDRHWRLGAAAGLGLGTLGQLLVLWLARGELDATPLQRLAAVLYSSALWAWTALALGLATAALLRWRAGRIAALALSGGVLGLLSLAVVSGTALRILSGSYLTAGAVAFALNSSDHFIHGATGGYMGMALGLVLVLVTSGVGYARWLRPAAQDATVARPHVMGALAVLSALALVLALVFARRGSDRFTRGMFISAPLLALASSLRPGESFELDRGSAMAETIAEPMAPPGPPRGEHDKWVERVKRAPSELPNVVLLMLESVAPGHMSLNGYSRPTTPEIDRLAREGLWMTRAWTTATHSNYAQPAALSSLFPRRVHGLDQYERLDYPRFLFHDTFHALGFKTATVSSQDESWQGMRRFQDTGTPTFFWFSDDYQGVHLDSGVEKTVPDEDTTKVAIDWLDKTEGRFALLLNLQGTHFPYSLAPGAERPYQPDTPTWSTFNYLGFPEAEREVVINRYDNAMRHVDAQVGRLRRYLERTGRMDDTLWIVTADHGEMFFEKGLVTHGKSLYDIEARVPLVLRWPTKIPAEKRDEPVSQLDILPTVLDYLGLPPHPSWQGRSFRVADPSGVGRHAVFMNIQGLRFADAIVCWPYKLVLDRTSGEPYLFRLDQDPTEDHNLVEQLPGIARRLTATLSKQLIAQLDYHREAAQKARDARFAPRLRDCPKLD